MSTVIAQVGQRQIGNRISNRYQVLERLGRGSTGEVYRVADEHLRMEVALKLFEPMPGQPATWDEAQALKELQSEYLLTVYNADIANGTDIRYLTMPVMDSDLEAVATPFGVDAAKAVHWGQQMGYGLERIHAAGLLHRDVKPGNAFIDASGDALLGDLGLAVQMDSGGHSPMAGTFATVAPEVLTTGMCSVASDVYSLAATVFYLLSGQYPNGPLSLDMTARRDRIINGQFDKLRDISPQVSQSLGTIVEHGLCQSPEQRPGSAQEFANQLARCSLHRRTWRRITSHNGHDRCFVGGAIKSAKEVAVCVLLDARGRGGIEVRLATGRRLRQHEKNEIPRDQVSTVLRSLLRRL